VVALGLLRSDANDPGEPVVLFVNDEPWNSFHQLAAALRRSGISPIWVTDGAERGRFSRFVERTLYGDAIDIGAAGGLDRMERLVRSGRVIDVQVNERFLFDLGDKSIVAQLIAEATGISVDQRARWSDKVAYMGAMEALGVRVPHYCFGTTPKEAADLLGYPLVVKARVGTHGTEVRVVRDAAMLADAVAVIGDPSTLLFQQFIGGALYGYGAARGTSGTIAEFTARETKGSTNPLGPTAVVHTIDDDRLATIGRRALDALGCRGLAAVEFLADARDDLWLIDISTRAWGGFSAFTDAGVDFAAAYVDVLRNACDVRAYARTMPDRTVRVVPTAAVETASSESFLRLSITLGRDLRPYVRRLGLRYCLVASATVLVERRLLARSRRIGDN
jgi:hypothetical protein